MAKGSEIVVTSPQRGVRIGGYVSGTPKPGTVMELYSSEPVAGRHTWRVYQPGTDGEQRVIAVLDYKWREGKLATDAYETGEYIELYFPVPGEELNMLVANVAGTSDHFAIGDVLMVDTGTGKLVATTGSPESEPFQVLETVSALTADTLVWCMFTGY